MKLVLAAFALFALFASQQTPAPASPDAEKKDEGIPVTSPLVRQRCGSCHRADEQGRMTRISYRRTTPEGWEKTIQRMVSLNGVKLDPSDAREIVRYLADHHGLAPEEARPARVRGRAPPRSTTSTTATRMPKRPASSAIPWAA